jgi:hypothetical protein
MKRKKDINERGKRFGKHRKIDDKEIECGRIGKRRERRNE